MVVNVSMKLIRYFYFELQSYNNYTKENSFKSFTSSSYCENIWNQNVYSYSVLVISSTAQFSVIFTCTPLISQRMWFNSFIL